MGIYFIINVIVVILVIIIFVVVVVVVVIIIKIITQIIVRVSIMAKPSPEAPFSLITVTHPDIGRGLRYTM